MLRGTPAGLAGKLTALGALKVGGSLRAMTVNWKLALPALTPSLALTMIVATPFAFATGVMLRLRLLPVPLMTMPALDTNEVSLLLTVTVGLFGPSLSVTVNGISALV